MSRPHSSTLVSTFETPSHAMWTPPSWATESSPYSQNTRSKSCSARADADGLAGAARRDAASPGEELVEEEPAQDFGERE